MTSLIFKCLFALVLLDSAKGETSISPETLQACDGGVVITRSQGLIMSPNFPRNYYPNMLCNWTVIASRHHYAGVGFCGRIAPPDILSVSNQVSVVFSSDASMAERGFLIGWELKESCMDNEFSCWSGFCINSRLQCDQHIDCPDGSDEIECAHASEDDVEECGVQINSPRFPANFQEPRIVFGSLAAADSWPWQARLIRNSNLRGKCGGSVINSLVILTAGHCVDDFHRPEELLVQIGALNRSVPGWKSRLHELRSFAIHPLYTVKNFLNDVAVLVLKERLTFSDLIRPICLLNVQNRDFELLSTRCVTTGFGDIDHTEGKIYPTQIFQARIRIRDHKQCVEIYRNIKVPVSTSQVCAGYGVGDACQGDSGGPLVCLHKDNYHWFQIGIVSFGVRCSDDKYPGIYTRVSAYSKWIRNEMRWAEACYDVHDLAGRNSTVTSGSFTSPNYPNNYFNNLDCAWTIISQQNRVVRLNFTRFKMGDDCFRQSGDYVSVFTDRTRILRLCDQRTPEYMTSDAGNVTITFHSDSKLTETGFMFSWQILRVHEVSNANEVVGMISHDE